MQIQDFDGLKIFQKNMITYELLCSTVLNNTYILLCRSDYNIALYIQ